MNITYKLKVAVATCSILGLGGLGVGTALAAQAAPKSTPAVQAPATTSAAPESTAGPHTDTVQQGDQTTPDTSGASGEKPEAPEANGANHQDADGVNVDYTPPGEAPEAG